MLFQDCDHEDYDREQAVNDPRLYVWTCKACNATTSDADTDIDEDGDLWLTPTNWQPATWQQSSTRPCGCTA